MASFNQDFIIFDQDTLLLRYTFTDLESTFNSSWGVYWGAALKSTWPGVATPVQEKATANWTTTVAINPDDNNISVVSGDVIVNVFFTQANFGEGNLLPNTEYYTELVVSNNANEINSVVAATGLFYVSQSMFTQAGYRP